jgi:threonine aldolase
LFLRGVNVGTHRVLPMALLREVLEAPQAVVFFVTTGTAANALALASLCPPWGAVLCHEWAHVEQDECAAPEAAGVGKLVGVPGDHGRITPGALAQVLDGFAPGNVHSVQPAALTITNVTEAGTIYSPAEVAALTAVARAHNIPSHLDGARFANALVATGATAAEMTWKAGVDLVSFGGTKNGCLGVEAVVIFDPAHDWEFQLRRKRAGHLSSKNRFLAAQMLGYLQEDLWLDLATHANAMGARLAQGLAGISHVSQRHPVQANMMFPEWEAGTHERLKAAGAVYYPFPAPDGREGARLVTSWSTKPEDVDSFLAAF